MGYKLDVIIPRATDRVFLSGMTGSGKTVLARELLETRKDNLRLVYDAKDELNWNGYKRFTKLSKLIRANPLSAIYAPNIYELDDPKFHEAFFKFAFLRQRKNFKKGIKLRTTVYTDEVYAVVDNQELPFYYKACLTRGRTLGVETWSATQRPKLIPQFLMSEAEHKYIFYHQMPQDKKKLQDAFGISEDMLESLSMANHEFVYANLDRISGKLKLKGVR